MWNELRPPIDGNHIAIKPMIKRIDKSTERKLYWLFIPMAVVCVWLMVYLFSGVNLLLDWFGIDVDVLTWCKPALIVSLLIVFSGYSIAAIRQKCWGEFAIGLVMLLVVLLNMGNVFVDLLTP